jgi:flagellin-like hook-associated protein FlgL
MIMINFNQGILGLGITNQINQNSKGLQRVLEQLSSGERITSFAVDASGGAIATRLESAFRGLAMQISQDQTQVNRLQTEEAGVGGITDELQAIRELQVQAQNGALAPQDVQALQAEVDQRVANIADLVENTQFAGTALIDPGAEITGIIENGIDVQGDIAATDVAIEEVLSERSEIGAEINAVQSRINQREQAFENTVGSFSRLQDLDIAAGVTEKVNRDILQQLSIRSLRSLFVFNRQNALSLLDSL